MQVQGSCPICQKKGVFLMRCVKCSQVSCCNGCGPYCPTCNGKREPIKR